MTAFRAFWLLCALLATTAAAEPAPAPPDARERIVVLGDSITAGYGLAPAQAYPALLQQKIDQAGLPFEVVNAGLSGDTTASGLRRVDWALSRGAAILIVALGGNDGLRGIAPAQTAANLSSIIQRARTKVPGITVLLAGMQMPGNLGEEYVTAFKALYPQVAAEQGAGLIPFLLEGVGGSETLNQADRIHPTAEGQQRVAENVWKVLQPLLAKRAAAAARP